MKTIALSKLKISSFYIGTSEETLGSQVSGSTFAGNNVLFMNLACFLYIHVGSFCAYRLLKLGPFTGYTVLFL